MIWNTKKRITVLQYFGKILYIKRDNFSLSITKNYIVYFQPITRFHLI